MEEAIEAWEGEGGSPRPLEWRSATQSPLGPGLVSAGKLIGTPGQVAWAEQIKSRVSAEFDRVAKALQAAAGKQAEQDRMDTQAIIAILEEKRIEVMTKDQAGYFIHDWQELRDQVRQMIVQDSRYQTIQAQRAARDANLANSS